MTRISRHLLVFGSLCLVAGAVTFILLKPAVAQESPSDSDGCEVYRGIHPVIGPEWFTMEVNFDHPSSVAYACQPTVCIIAHIECLKEFRPTLWKCQHLSDKPRVYRACIKKDCPIEKVAEGQGVKLAKGKVYI